MVLQIKIIINYLGSSAPHYHKYQDLVLCKSLFLFWRKNQTGMEEVASLVEEETCGSGRVRLSSVTSASFKEVSWNYSDDCAWFPQNHDFFVLLILRTFFSVTNVFLYYHDITLEISVSLYMTITLCSKFVRSCLNWKLSHLCFNVAAATGVIWVLFTVKAYGSLTSGYKSTVKHTTRVAAVKFTSYGSGWGYDHGDLVKDFSLAFWS